MQSTFIAWLRGYVRIELRGGNFEAFVNQAIEQKYAIWNIRVLPNERMEAEILIKDFFELRPILKRTGCRLHVTSRWGLPFWLSRIGNRKLFVSGIAGFIIGLYLLTSLVWQIQVEGNEKLSQSEILQAASKLGIHRFQWKFRLPESAALSHQLQGSLPGTAWVGVEVHGTRITIKVVEAAIPDKKPLMNPRNLVASKNALITEILADKGKPLVKPNMYVRKGDVLISGVIGNEQNQQVVVANGKVLGIVWYTSHIEAPLSRTFKVYSGETKDRSYLVLGTRALQVTGYGKLPFEKYETIAARKTLQWRNYVLPVGWLHEKVMEAHDVEHPISSEEAKASSLAQARAELLTSSGKDSRIAGEKILHEKTENGKVYMEVHFEVEESIVEEQPIVTQGE
jgi:similar to stage IV sporulation protein